MKKLFSTFLCLCLITVGLSANVILSPQVGQAGAVNIDGGAIDGTAIGATSAAAGTFTTVTGTSLDCNGAADISGNFVMSGSGNTTLTGTLTLGVATGNATITTGNVNLTVVIGGVTYYVKAHTSE